ncbi:MAG: Asp-tRNA(Asn)/Glu-tRNA(Gln) amidotransferase subunit GatB [Reyranellaceae bacterium]
MSLIKGETGEWEMVIGLEVHAQVVSQAKLFSSAPTEFGADPNTQVSLVDAAMPGMLPVINAYCVEQAVRTGLGLKAQINLHSVFDRKNYFYADLPAGYQISQYKQPVVGEGTIVLDMKDGESREVGIERLHLEQDAGKSLHDQHPTQTYIDLNRAGVALMEIVSKPDMRNADEAAAYLTKLRSILRYLGTCDGNMEEGSMRCDVNVSVRKPGGELGTRCEIKNVNSIRFVKQAIEYEARRQIEIIEGGGEIRQETRLFDANKGETRSMRSKEEAHDYRYFPDPDLLPLVLKAEFVDGIKASLPELPDEKKARFVERFGFTPYQASVLVADKESAEAFEKKLLQDEFFRSIESATSIKLYLVGKSDEKPTGEDYAEYLVSANASANTVMTDIFAVATEKKLPAYEVIEKTDLAGRARLMREKVINARIWKDIVPDVVGTNKPIAEIVEEKGLKQVTDTGAIEAAVDQIIAANPDKVEQYRAKPTMLGWFVGQVMKATGGKANPAAVNELLKKKLDG